MRSRKRKNDTLYHVLFWVIVVLVFPVSLSVWFFRKNPLNMTEQARKLCLGLFWGIIAIIILLCVGIPISKKNREERKASVEASLEAEKQSSIAASEAEAKKASEEEAAKSKLEVTVFDMGQSDAILIECDGYTMLIDSGDLSVALSAKLLEKNVSKIDYFIASTPQNESVGGIARALNHVDVDKVFCTITDYDSDKFTGFMAALEGLGKNISVPAAGDTFQLGSATVTFLGPVSAPQTVEDSLVVKVTHQANTFLFAGFADTTELNAILDNGGDIKADVIKVGRHGRDNALSESLLSRIAPKTAIVSAGEGYGCPSESTLQLLCNADIALYRTDLQGNIGIVSTRDGLKFSVEEGEDIDTYQGITKTTSEPSTETPTTAEPVTETTAYSGEFETGEATPNESGWRYGRLKSDMVFHRLNCPLLQAVGDDDKEYFSELREEMNSWFSPCEVCHPMN